MKENKVLIIASLDGFANSTWSLKLKQYISQRGYEVDIWDTLHLSRLVSKRYSLRTKLPKPSFYAIILYFIEFVYYVLIDRFLKRYKIYFGYFFITSMMKVRGKILSKRIQSHHYDLIICVSQLDSYALTSVDKNCRTLFSCPTPFADELYYGKLISKGKHEKFRNFEIRIFESCTYLAFHWKTYANYVRKYYKYDRSNIIQLDLGAEVKLSKAAHNLKPKIIYLGKLDGYWINLPLLSKLSKVYPIDVYGLPAPDPSYGLNYKGYATPDVLNAYQFGLITITDDNLRKEGFSAKHLDYLSYGLPVLVPEWRENAKELKGTILFNERNFLAQIKYYSQQEYWDILHKEALEQTSEVTWEVTLKALYNVLDSSFCFSR